MKIGYARISTKSQLENYSLEQQEKALLSEGCTLVYKEQFTGTTTDRPVFNEVKAILLKNADSGEQTILVVTKLDRFARTTVEGMKIMQELLDVGVAVHILNFGNIIGGFNSTNKLMFSIFMAFAEYERDMIVERCQSGKETARSKPNFKDGRPNKFTKDQMDLALELKKDNSYKKIERMTGISKSTLIREMRRRGLITL